MKIIHCGSNRNQQVGSRCDHCGLQARFDEIELGRGLVEAVQANQFFEVDLAGDGQLYRADLCRDCAGSFLEAVRFHLPYFRRIGERDSGPGGGWDYRYQFVDAESKSTVRVHSFFDEDQV